MDVDLSSDSFETLTARLSAIHDRLLEIAPGIDRVACALYDAGEDTLKTFFNSTRNGRALRSYQYRLSDSESLSYLARTRELRLLTDIQNQLTPSSAHSSYVLDEGYQSSFTVPLSSGSTFIGFLFFDSRQPDTFTASVQREVLLYANLLAMAISSEIVAVRTIVGTVQIARDFTELRDLETAAHLDRMARYSRLITRGLVDELDLADEFVESVFLYAPMHDIGKIGIPDAILLKPGPLTADEWEVMKTHTTKGRQMVDTITKDLGLERLPHDSVMRNIIEFHHEAMNGSGYPSGLAGDAIPLEARIVSVADVYDALTSKRPYKDAWSSQAAYVELHSMVERGKFDARVVRALADARPEAAEIAVAHAEPG